MPYASPSTNARIGMLPMPQLSPRREEEKNFVLRWKVVRQGLDELSSCDVGITLSLKQSSELVCWTIQNTGASPLQSVPDHEDRRTKRTQFDRESGILPALHNY